MKQWVAGVNRTFLAATRTRRSSGELASVGILHLLLIYAVKLNKEQWRLMDYLWISLTAIGLFSTAAQVRVSIQ
jgi:hypothetical protein